METIENGVLRAAVSETGAEMQSLQSIETGFEYLWQGDSRWWGRRSPVLFPIVGGLWDGVCHISGQTVHIPKHGLLRSAPWRVVEREKDRVKLEHISTVGDFATFPFAFAITADYALRGGRMVVTFEVKNLGSADLWFQVGGHPGLNLPHWNATQRVDGYLLLEGEPTYVRRAGEQSCLVPQHYPVPTDADGLIPLSVETFANEALIFPDHQITAITLLNTARRPVARVKSEAGAWLVWNPAGQHSPFVCLEPWYGLCDEIGFTGDVAKRTLINRLSEGETWRGGYDIETLFG